MSTAGEVHFKLRRDIRRLRGVVATLREHAGRGVAVPIQVDELVALADGLDSILTQAAVLAETVALGKSLEAG